MVRIRDMGAHPKDVAIKRENAVSWLNDDPIAHDVTFDDFSSGPIPPGELYTHVFNETGTFHYYCSRHKRYMEGTVTVT
jgi:plastocyanin